MAQRAPLHDPANRCGYERHRPEETVLYRTFGLDVATGAAVERRGGPVNAIAMTARDDLVVHTGTDERVVVFDRMLTRLAEHTHGRLAAQREHPGFANFDLELRNIRSDGGAFVPHEPEHARIVVLPEAPAER